MIGHLRSTGGVGLVIRVRSAEKFFLLLTCFESPDRWTFNIIPLFRQNAFFLSAASTPGAITGGTGKYRLSRGEVQSTDTVVSPNGTQTYYGFNFIFTLS